MGKDKDAEDKDADQKDKDADKKKDAEPAYKQPDLKKYKKSLTAFFESLPKDVPNLKSNVLAQVEAVATNTKAYKKAAGVEELPGYADDFAKLYKEKKEVQD